MSRDIIEGFKTIPEIEGYVKERNLKERKRMRNKYSLEKTEIKIPSRTLSKIEEWNNKFERTKMPIVPPPTERKLNYELVERLLRDETYRKKLTEEASHNASVTSYLQ